MTLTFKVAGILETVATKFGLNAGTDGIEDDCYGVAITSNQTYTQFLNKHKSVYNYLIMDDLIDNVPIIRLVSRAVNDGIEIDTAVLVKDCIVRSPNAPAIKYNRVDPMILPRAVELQYISFDRGFAINAQYARNEGARVQQAIYSASVDFILSDEVARQLAYDLLYRIWSQQLTVAFEHPDLTIEPADIVQVQTDQGLFVVQILNSLITKEPITSGIGRTNQLVAQLLLTRKGVTVNPGRIVTTGAFAAFTMESESEWLFDGEATGPIYATATFAGGSTLAGVGGV